MKLQRRGPSSHARTLAHVGDIPCTPFARNHQDRTVGNNTRFYACPGWLFRRLMVQDRVGLRRYPMLCILHIRTLHLDPGKKKTWITIQTVHFKVWWPQDNTLLFIRLLSFGTLSACTYVWRSQVIDISADRCYSIFIEETYAHSKANL